MVRAALVQFRGHESKERPGNSSSSRTWAWVLGSEFLQRKTWGRRRVATETCPQYLVFDRDTDRGVQGTVNPPLRSAHHVEALWQRLTDGMIDALGSDRFTPFSSGLHPEQVGQHPSASPR